MSLRRKSKGNIVFIYLLFFWLSVRLSSAFSDFNLLPTFWAFQETHILFKPSEFNVIFQCKVKYTIMFKVCNTTINIRASTEPWSDLPVSLKGKVSKRFAGPFDTWVTCFVLLTVNPLWLWQINLLF